MADSSDGVLGTILWAIIWGLLAYFSMGMTWAAFGYGFAMSILAGIVVLVTLIPFIGIVWYVGIFNFISDALLVGLGLHAGIITTVMLWIGMAMGFIVGAVIIIAILWLMFGRN